MCFKQMVCLHPNKSGYPRSEVNPYMVLEKTYVNGKGGNDPKTKIAVTFLCERYTREIFRDDRKIISKYNGSKIFIEISRHVTS